MKNPNSGHTHRQRSLFVFWKFQHEEEAFEELLVRTTRRLLGIGAKGA
jgi:hypothetical protein